MSEAPDGDDVDATVRVRRGGSLPEPTEAPDPDEGSTVVVRRESRRREEAAAAAAAAELDQTAVSARNAPPPAPDAALDGAGPALAPSSLRYPVRTDMPSVVARAEAVARRAQEPVDIAAQEALRRRAALRRALLTGLAVLTVAAVAAVALIVLALAG